MLRRLTIVIVLLFTSLVGLIIGSRLIGRTQPKPQVLTRVFSTIDGSERTHEIPPSSHLWKAWYGFTRLERYTPIFTN